MGSNQIHEEYNQYRLPVLNIYHYVLINLINLLVLFPRLFHLEMNNSFSGFTNHILHTGKLICNA